MKKWIYNALIVLFAGVLAVSAFFLISYFWESYRQERRYEDLAQLAQVPPRPTVEQEEDVPPTAATEPALVTVVNPATGQTLQVLPDFAQLYTLNSDLVGWIKIPGTDIDYPVMQTPDSPDYYLTRNFDRQDSAYGCLYAREVCDVFAPSDNITIYGHHMKDGSMFAQLERYLEKTFWEENPYIYFDNLTQKHTYEIMAVFRTTAVSGEGFAYHSFVNAAGDAEFAEFADTCKDLSLYDTGIHADYGDKLITLSTCEYTRKAGRLVVVARQIA